MKIPKEVTDSLRTAKVAYIITVSDDKSEAFLIGSCCQDCQTDAIVDAMLNIMQAEASEEGMPEIFTQLMEVVNHEEGRVN